MVIRSIAADSIFERLREELSAGREVIHLSGVWGSSAPMTAAMLSLRTARPVLYLTAHLEQADDARDDLEFFLARSCELFPAWETLPGEGAGHLEIEAERLRLCGELLRKKATPAQPDPTRGLQPAPSRETKHGSEKFDVIVAPILALMQPVPTQDVLRANTLELVVGRTLDWTDVGNSSRPSAEAVTAGSVAATGREGCAKPRSLRAGRKRVTGKQSGVGKPDGPDALLAWAVDRGFERLDLVESPGDVASRGDIVDLFAPGEQNPYRIEFFDERIESIRRFDVSTQRSIESLQSVSIAALGKPERSAADGVSDLCAYLPKDVVVVLEEPMEIQSMGETIYARLGGPQNLFRPYEVLANLSRFQQVQLSPFAGGAARGEAQFDLIVRSLSRFEGTATDAVGELCRMARRYEVHVVCDTEGERHRLRELIAEQSKETIGGKPVPHEAANENVHTYLGVIHRGFTWTNTDTIVLSHAELFHRRRQRRRIRKIYAGQPIESWLDLQPGERVVHVIHGIAVYRGLRKMQKGESGQQEEFLCLEFAERAVVYVPCSQIDLVQKYIGAGGRPPKLSKVGGKRWDRAKQKAADAVSELAESMLRIQALRDAAEGTSYPRDTSWQREFEAAFPYEETEDQLHVAGEIRGDLMRTRPMDRLVCGDVGYGKTELAMRAAFKVVEYGRQVAVLVPTTVLAEQHYETFRQRMAEYPFVVASLSRFRSGLEQRKIIEGLRKGQIDVVIGTHRLLSRDVRFADLGLVITDEEQRFGVEHKERLKMMRETVDVLTLTATPIPRTLHMSLMGIRDISSLQTPPIDRRAIATEVRPFGAELIRTAILREMSRDGQVYFLHNFVESIAAMADRVRAIVPEARVVYGHGQMRDDELEEVMHRFVQRQADVLVCTTIIESGIDIPSVNTIFINRAERFGLADLHQLRGRVGRSSHRAYCYLLLSPDRPPTPKAARRLKTIEEFSELGAGFRIAMRDLEIRGAGNLLGREQSGHIAAVGYEMYCRLLNQAVRRLKNEPDPTPPPLAVDLDVAAHVPASYIAGERARIEVYRRVASCRTPEDLTQLERDLLDAFGPLPREVARLLELAEIRVLGRKFGIVSITRRPPDVIFVVKRLSQAEPLFMGAPGSVRMPDERTIHLRPPPSYLEPDSLLPILQRMFHRASQQTESLVKPHRGES